MATLFSAVWCGAETSPRLAIPQFNRSVVGTREAEASATIHIEVGATRITVAIVGAMITAVATVVQGYTAGLTQHSTENRTLVSDQYTTCACDHIALPLTWYCM